MGKNKEHDEYINSTEWKKVREYFFQNVYERKCYVCGRTKEDKAIIQLHHNSYQYFKDEINHPDCVIPLCSTCHRLVHGMKHNLSRFSTKKVEEKPKKVRKRFGDVGKK